MIKIIINESTLEAAIARTNLSRKQLAIDLGVSRSYLSRILNGKDEPSSGVRQRFL